MAEDASDTETSGRSAPRRLELLAPAGDRAALDAALEAGANAVYFGLKSLNARRRAQNFGHEEFAAAVAHVHAQGARAYLTLNIDLVERELGQAARVLEFARRAGIDAVLVRDPALLAMRREFPELEFHFSTQTSMTSSADVAAAAELGANRVVLARELSLKEIAAASAVAGVATEVFVQGALCFSVSGRCLMSSWVGGRSGNRGACTSPCRVPWSDERGPQGTPLSMRDLAAVHRLADLEKAGVRALKIEGRLKNAAWVHNAVALYRQAIDEPRADLGALLSQAGQLGSYTGRQLTCGYLDAQRDELTGTAAGRERRTGAPEDKCDEASTETEVNDLADDAETPYYDLSITIDDRGIVCRIECNGITHEWTMPRTVVRRAHKATPVGKLFERLEAAPLEGFELGLGETNEPDFLLVPRSYNAIVDALFGTLRRARKGPIEQVKIELAPAVRDLLEKASPHAANRLHLGDRPTRVRLEAHHVDAFVRHVHPAEVIVEGVTSESLERVLTACVDTPAIFALPAVFFESDLAELRRLTEKCAKAGVTVEVNSWGGWHLARTARARMEAGPGLPVLNSLAARQLGKLGMRSVTLDIEADRRQLEAITAACGVPCALVVFGRPALMTTRVDLPRDDFQDVLLTDRRGLRVRSRREGGLWVFRPDEPFDLRNVENERISVKSLVVDLVGAADPLGDWYDVPMPGRDCFRFNYDRSLA